MKFMVERGISAFCLMMAGAIAVPAGAFAQTNDAANGDIAGNSELTTQLQNADAGKKIYVQSHTGKLSFAGHDIETSQFSGFFGLAADIAYVVVAEGSVSIGDENARRGKMLLIPPFGGRVSSDRYDAARLIANKREANPIPAALKTKFEKVAKGQSRAITLGRLGRTNFNVAASGLAQNEIARRSIVGGKTLQQMRFGKIDKTGSFEAKVVDRFASALKLRDAAVVAELLDPLSYGAGDLTGGGDAARMLMAKAIVSEHDWSAILANYNIEEVKDGAGSYWKIGGGIGTANITLRTTTDFIFISSVSKGG